LENDVVVIGAGPAGLLAAREAALRGCSVLVLEEHKEVGRPDHCAGLLSTSGLATLGLRPPSSVIQNHVKGARIHSPSGHSILIERGQREALVVDRALFDQWLAERATDAGAVVRVEAHVSRLLKRGRAVAGVRLRDGTEMPSRLVIDGEGSRGVLVREAGLLPVPKRNRLPAYQVEVRGANVDEEVVQMFYGRRVAPGFFAWIIPLGDGRARVGVAAKSRARQRLLWAMKHHPPMRTRLEQATIERGYGGVVLVGMPIPRTVTHGMLVVGDAAGIVKATTGGGVIIGGGAAIIAGRVATKATRSADLSLKTLAEYEHSWRALYIRDLRAMYVVQRLLAALTDRGMDELVASVDELGLVSVVRQSGDMDRQGRVIAQLLRNPKSYLAALRAIGHVNLAQL